jgi:hypothetical protein
MLLQAVLQQKLQLVRQTTNLSMIITNNKAMKRILLVMTVMCISAITFAQNKELIQGPAISLNKDVHDYGEIPYGGNGTCEFKVTNTGNEPLILSTCQGSCGCTVPKCDPNPILPGESSIITVKYDTSRSGPISKSVTISSNAKNEPVKVVNIKGNVGPAPTDAGSGH